MSTFDINTEKIISWILDQDWTINFRGRRNEADHFDSQINISYQTRGKTLLYTLLHEAGHVVLRSDPAYFMTKYQGITAALVSPSKMFNTNYKVDTVKEEFDAWRIGEELANELCLDIDLNDYNKFGNKCLMSYIKWANK